MSILTIHNGRDRGAAGADGSNGLGVADIDSNKVNNYISGLLFNNNPNLKTTITATRDSSAFFTDRYNVPSVASGTSVVNYVPYSNDFSLWSDTFSAWSIIGATADPVGGTSATEINLDVDTAAIGGSAGIIEQAITGVLIDSVVNMSVWIKVLSGSLSSFDFTIAPTSGRYGALTPSSGWVRVQAPAGAIAALTGFSLNPRGDAGTRIAIYEAQLIDGAGMSEIVHTEGIVPQSTTTNYQPCDSDRGYLLEGSKTNLCTNSNDLSKWTKTNCSIGTFDGVDGVGFYSQYALIEYGSLPDVYVETDTDATVNGAEYNVSFYAYLTAGSMQTFSVSIGGGANYSLEIPSITGWARYNINCISGSNENIKFHIYSPSLTAKLAISGVQIETGYLSSYIYTATQAESRVEDNIQIPYEYNFPSPLLPWSLSFRFYGIDSNDSIKYIFSNQESGANEFSVYFQDDDLYVKMGVNSISFNMISANQIGIVFDGANIKLYNKKTLVSTQALAAGGIVSSAVRVGENASCYLSNIVAYNLELSDNNMIYLQGL